MDAAEDMNDLEMHISGPSRDRGALADAEFFNDFPGLFNERDVPTVVPLDRWTELLKPKRVTSSH